MMVIEGCKGSSSWMAGLAAIVVVVEVKGVGLWQQCTWRVLGCDSGGWWEKMMR